MERCSASATATPSGSRSEERRMHAQLGERLFVPGERSHFQSSALLGLLPHTASALPVIPLQLDFMVRPNLCFFRDSGAIAAVASFSRRKRKDKRKKTAAGKSPRRCCGRQAKARVTFHPAGLRNFFTKRCGRRCALRLWNPEIALTTLSCRATRCPTSDRANPA